MGIEPIQHSPCAAGEKLRREDAPEAGGATISRRSTGLPQLMASFRAHDNNGRGVIRQEALADVLVRLGAPSADVGAVISALGRSSAKISPDGAEDGTLVDFG